MGIAITQPGQQDKLQILNQYRFFSDSEMPLQQHILSNSKTINLNTGSYFFKRGSHVNQLALIGAGSVRVFIPGECGRELTLYHLQAGEICPINILSILINQTAPASAIVEGPLHAVVIDAACFCGLVSTDAGIRQYVFESFALRFQDVVSLFEKSKFKKLETRLAAFLINSLPAEKQQPIVVKVTHERLAAELGSAREVISRLLEKLERSGIVRLTRGRINICNLPALQKIAHE